ncbi:mucin-like protein [Venturia nashicola]|nr:mucin-like protein [Venturia nashicola]
MVKMLLQPPAVLLAEPEFYQLPPSIQRKYFSTLERLQIAQNSLYLCDAPTSLQFRPVINSFPVRKCRGPFHPRRPRGKNLDSLGPGIVSHAETRWFLSLPEKVRRQHFSREEQHQFGENIAASHSSRSRSTSRNTGNHPEKSSNFLAPRTSCSQRTSKSTRVSYNLPRTSVDAMNCFDGRPPVARQDSIKGTVPVNFSKKRPSNVATHVRLPSFTATSAPQTPASPGFPHHRPGHSRTTTLTVRPSIDSVSRTIDPTAKYYQDPEARQKLRQYLSSPQKFDEAVEFGFPSNPNAPDADFLFRTHRSTSSNDAQAFLKDEVISFIDRYGDNVSEDSSEAYPDSPATPADGDELGRRKPYGSSIFASLDSTDVPSLNFKMDSEILAQRFSQEPLANREMTLRMTLTRPELRADDEDLYGWSKKEEDPLALEQLPMSDDTTGENGVFAVKTSNRRSGMIKRIFCKAKNER